jgi:hypothetical protein
MKLLLCRHLWGVDLSKGLQAAAAGWRATGYEAVEASIRHVPDREAFRRFLREGGWGWVAGAYTDMFENGGSVARHLASLREQIEEVVEDRPLLINSHSGCDHWSAAQAEDFFGGALELEKEFGVVLTHETHRRRFLATPWAAEAVLAKFPELKLTADLSHWVCVCERLLEDFGPLIERVVRQTWHVHGRVGHEHGPQVPDPRAPEWATQLRAHEAWWDAIWAAQRARGQALSTFTPEFGPPNYLWTQPHTREPLADLAAVCDWMAERTRGRFG